VVELCNPTSLKLVSVVVPASTASRNILYPVTPTLSVEADQVRSTRSKPTSVAVTSCGTEGGSVSVGGVTSRLAVLLVTPSCVAVTLVVPAVSPVAKPEAMVATTMLELAQVAVAVKSAELLSLYCRPP